MSIEAGPLRIAVVDSGMTASHPHLRGARVEGFGIDDRGVECEDYSDLHGHGTAVAAAILGTGVAADLLAVRVLGADLRCRYEVLCLGIIRAAERGAQLINISMGTRDPAAQEPMRDAVARAAEAGAVVVAAAPQSRTAWPADLDAVVGVEADPSLTPGRHRIVVRDCPLPDGRRADVLRFVAHGRARPADRLARNFAGNSLAAAQMTHIVAATWSEAPDLEPADLIRRLQRDGARRSA